MNSNVAPLNRSFANLRRFAEQSTKPVEHCEMCSLPLAPEHQHLIDPESRRLICSCDACSLLFPNQPELKYRRIPRDPRRLKDFQLTNAQWDDLLVPINVAFFFFSTSAQRVVVLYPSPAGATESLLELDAWNEIVEANPVLESMEPDVEALLVNRLGEQHGQWEFEYFIAPIDKCYQLVGLIRIHWRGLSGGMDVWREIKSYFDVMKERAR